MVKIVIALIVTTLMAIVLYIGMHYIYKHNQQRFDQEFKKLMTGLGETEKAEDEPAS